MSLINTSYARQYTIVSKDATHVVLRVLDDSLYATYWKEFISAKVDGTSAPMYLRIEQAPPTVVLIDQYANFTPEMPLVSLEANGRRINVSSRITANTPNTEVPGLFRIDYRINLTKDMMAPIWSSYVSIQQRPILRKAAAGWVRDNYVIRTLNRLVMEPQFMEALHAAGEPLYGFMEANQHPSIKASMLGNYAGVQAWGAGGVYNSCSSGIFVPGLKLPQGSIIVYNKRLLQLREPVWPDPIGTSAHMNPENHLPARTVYSVGSVVRSGDDSYICVSDTDSTDIGNTGCWKKGFLYKFNALDGGCITLPKGCLPVGIGGVEHIWVTVDNQGYSFWVDIANCTAIGTYRGYYDRKNYADYGTGDIVAYITEDMVRLYRRKATDIQAEDTLKYPPGHHLNPAWEEIYARFPDERQPLLSDYNIVPHTNAANAIVAKTWSVSEEMCSAYGNMMGIPPLIVKECGAKWSALLFALLSRTRNTYEGLRICFRAVGLDIENLRIAPNPSIAYYCDDNNGETQVEDIYTQHENLRRLLANITTLAPGETAKAEDGNLRYVTKENVLAGEAEEKDIGNAIQQYSEDEGKWATRYRFESVQPTNTPIQNLNNRYYAADLNLLARLAEDAVVTLNNTPWVKEPAWAGSPSALAAECLAYEIPIYIYLRLKVRLYAENHITMQGFAYSGVFDGQRGGAKNVLELFPSKYFSKSKKGFVTIDTGVFAYVDNGWQEVPPTRVDEERGTKIYEFDHIVSPIRIMALDRENVAFVRYWQSTHTFGLLGLPGSMSTVNDVPFDPACPGHFHNVTAPGITDESELMLANGYVGVTALYKEMELYAGASVYSWLYILEWTMDGETPFADYVEAGTLPILPYAGSVTGLYAALDHITFTEEAGIGIPPIWNAEHTELLFYGEVPPAIYLWNANDELIGAYTIGPCENVLTAEDWNVYYPSDPIPAARIRFTVA